MADIDKYFDHHHHHIDAVDHQLLDHMENHAKFRRDCKSMSKLLFSLFPIPVLALTLIVLSSELGSTLDAQFTYSYVVGVAVTCFFSIVLIATYAVLQIVDNAIMHQYFSSASTSKTNKANNSATLYGNQLVGHDDLTSFLVFAAALLNMIRGFVISQSVDISDPTDPYFIGISFGVFHNFAWWVACILRTIN